MSLHRTGCVPPHPRPAEAETKAQGEAREARSHVCTWLGTRQEGAPRTSHGQQEGRWARGRGGAGRRLGAERGGRDPRGTHPVRPGRAGAPGAWPGLLPTSSPTSWTGVSGWGAQVQQRALSHTGPHTGHTALRRDPRDHLPTWVGHDPEMRGTRQPEVSSTQAGAGGWHSGCPEEKHRGGSGAEKKGLGPGAWLPSAWAAPTRGREGARAGCGRVGARVAHRLWAPRMGREQV